MAVKGDKFKPFDVADCLEDAVPRALGVIARSQGGNRTWSTILRVTTALGLRFELHVVA